MVRARAYWSARPSRGPAPNSSGAMYSGVPTRPPPCMPESVRADGDQAPGEAEVAQVGVAVAGEQDVGRLDVPEGGGLGPKQACPEQSKAASASSKSPCGKVTLTWQCA